MNNQESSLRDKQISALNRMLNFNDDAEEEKENAFKILLFDKQGRDVISSVMRVQDLFKKGVTVHMSLSSHRTALQDVPVVYFVAPTLENIKQIAKDLENNMYESTYINFTSPLPRPLLEELAQETLQTSHQIQQVYDQYLDFVVTEPNVYSLGLDDVFKQVSSPQVNEKQIEQLVDQVVNGMFSVVMTQGAIPIIRCTRGGAAEAVATQLDKKLKNHVMNTKNSGMEGRYSGSRPVLILLDRNIDLVSMFTHSWTYQSLINDACELERNRIKINVDGEEKRYDLNPNDFFWNANSTLPFPEVADNLDAELNKYKQEAEEIKRQTGTTDLDNAMQTLHDDQPAGNTMHLKSAISRLPELTDRKKTIDMHMNIATTLLTAVRDRGLAQFYEAEENASKQTKASVMELIKNPEFKDHPEDKLRMFLIYYLVTDKISTADMADFEQALQEQGCDLSALHFIKRNKEMNKMAQMSYQSSSNAPQSNAQTDYFKTFSGITNKITERLKDGSLSSGSIGSLISGVQNFLPASKDLPITKIVESILEPANASSTTVATTDDYLYFDPKATRGALTRPPKRQSYDEAIVCVVGGGNYQEHTNLAEWVGRMNGSKRVIYGATQMCSPAKFLSECAELGKEF